MDPCALGLSVSRGGACYRPAALSSRPLNRDDGPMQPACPVRLKANGQNRISELAGDLCLQAFWPDRDIVSDWCYVESPLNFHTSVPRFTKSILNMSNFRLFHSTSIIILASPRLGAA